jgi:hypothetical protein
MSIRKMLDEELIQKICEGIEARFEALSKTEAAAEPQPGGELYHYTTAQGLLRIVESGQIWATNAQYLNDRSELSPVEAVLGKPHSVAAIHGGTRKSKRWFILSTTRLPLVFGRSTARSYPYSLPTD